MMYGAQWIDNQFAGTFTITEVRPPLNAPDLNAGYFEIEVEETNGLRAVSPGSVPPTNIPPVYYSYTLVQATNNDVVFMLARKAVPNNKVRYALAYEPGDYLKIYLPATTTVVSREIPGGAFLHIGQSALTFNVTAGNAQAGYDLSQGKEITEIKFVSDISGSLQNAFFFIPYEFGYYGFWIDVDNTSAMPPPAMLLVANQYQVIEIESNDTASAIAGIASSVIAGTGYWTTSVSLDTIITTDVDAGPRAPDANLGGSPFTVTVIQQGRWVYNNLTPEEWNQKIVVISDIAFGFYQRGYDINAIGGTATFSTPIRSVGIDNVHREQFFTTVVCSSPHNLAWYFSPYGVPVSDDTAAISVDIIETDSSLPEDQWSGPYSTDATKNYTLTTHYSTTREPITAGETLTSIQINGTLPNEPGLFMLDLNRDNEDGPFRYIAVQALNSPPSVNIISASQNNFLITVTTVAPHSLLVDSQVIISGTMTAMDGQYQIISTPSPTIFVAQSGTPAILFSATGIVTAVVNGQRSVVLLDPSNLYTKNHEAGADITVISSPDAYTPSPDGLDYPLYVTGTAQGRVYAQEIIDSIVALGIKLEIVVVFPSKIGLGNQGGSDSKLDPPTSEIVYVYGQDDYYGVD